MRIINPKKFVEAKKRFPEKKKAIDSVRATFTAITPKNSAELKNIFSSLEKFPGQPNCYRLDVGGRRGLRMVAVIQIRSQSVYLHMLGTHEEYEKFEL